MKKTALGLVLLIIFAVSGGIYYLFNNLDQLVETAIEKYGSEATQTAVRVDRVKINLKDAAGGIFGLTIANPGGYDMPYAFSLGEIRAGIDLQSLQQEPYIIDEVTVLAPRVFVVINEENKTNLNELKKNLASASAKSAQAKQAQPGAEDSAAAPRLIIRRVTFADGNIVARVAALKNKEYLLELPTLEMRDLGGSKGATADELASEILTRLTDRASDIVKKDIIDAELNKLKAKAQEKIDEERAKLNDQVDAKKAAEIQKAKDKLKNIFSK